MKTQINLLLLLLLLSQASAQDCTITVLQEEFSSTAPAGWTGDFNMLGGGLREGWLTESGATPTSDTGPDTASAGSHYLYFESSGPASASSMYSVFTPAVDIPSQGAHLSFDYLMHGSDIGTFYVVAHTTTSQDTLLELSGPQHIDGTTWSRADISLNAYGNRSIRIEFIGMKMVMGLGDIAIDEVRICSSPAIPTLGQWGVLCLSLLLLIVVAVRISSADDRTFQVS